MIYAVLGFQVILKIASKKFLSKLCDFFGYLSAFGLIIQFLANLRFIHNTNEAISIAFMYAVPGVIAGCYRIKNKYTK